MLTLTLICGNCQEDSESLSSSNWIQGSVCQKCKRLGPFMFIRHKNVSTKKYLTRVSRPNKQEKIDIDPMLEIVYPDRGGYTGFSIFIWKTNYMTPGTYHLISPWGSAEGASGLRPSDYVLEGRFFVFGSLLERVFVGEVSLSEAMLLADRLFPHWKPIMDFLKERETRLMKENGRCGIHIDEIVDDELRKFVQVKL